MTRVITYSIGSEKMRKNMLVLLVLVVVLALAGCGKKQPEPDAAGEDVKQKSVIKSSDDVAAMPEQLPEAAEIETFGGRTETGDPPEVVIKTQNKVSNQEADVMLDELDKQLTGLLDTLDRLDDVTDEDLKY